MSRSVAVTELLFSTFPLIRLVQGEKRLRIQRAWINAAQDNALMVLGVDDSLLPHDPRAAARELLNIAMQLGRQAGLTATELSEFFNDQVDVSALMAAAHPDDTVEAGRALLALMAASRLEARDTITTQERNQA